MLQHSSTKLQKLENGNKDILFLKKGHLEQNFLFYFIFIPDHETDGILIQDLKSIGWGRV